MASRQEILTSEEFEQLVVDAVSSLPPEIMARLDNVAITVEDWPNRAQLESSRVPPGSTLFGLYQGRDRSAVILRIHQQRADAIQHAGAVISVRRESKILAPGRRRLGSKTTVFQRNGGIANLLKPSRVRCGRSIAGESPGQQQADRDESCDLKSHQQPDSSHRGSLPEGAGRRWIEFQVGFV